MRESVGTDLLLIPLLISTGEHSLAYFSRQVFVIVARHEQQHTTVWILHCYRPQGHPIAPADDRRHDGAQLRTKHHAVLPETSQLLCSAFWPVTGPLRSGRDPQLSDLPGQRKEGGDQQPDRGGQRPSVSLPRHFEAGSDYRSDPVPQARIPTACDP